MLSKEEQLNVLAFTSYASFIFVNFSVASGSSVLSGCLKKILKKTNQHTSDI